MPALSPLGDDNEKFWLTTKEFAIDSNSFLRDRFSETSASYSSCEIPSEQDDRIKVEMTVRKTAKIFLIDNSFLLLYITFLHISV